MNSDGKMSSRVSAALRSDSVTSYDTITGSDLFESFMLVARNAELELEGDKDKDTLEETNLKENGTVDETDLAINASPAKSKENRTENEAEVATNISPDEVKSGSADKINEIVNDIRHVTLEATPNFSENSTLQEEQTPEINYNNVTEKETDSSKAPVIPEPDYGTVDSSNLSDEHSNSPIVVPPPDYDVVAYATSQKPTDRINSDKTENAYDMVVVSPPKIVTDIYAIPNKLKKTDKNEIPKYIEPKTSSSTIQPKPTLGGLSTDSDYAEIFINTDTPSKSTQNIASESNSVVTGPNENSKSNKQISENKTKENPYQTPSDLVSKEEIIYKPEHIAYGSWAKDQKEFYNKAVTTIENGSLERNGGHNMSPRISNQKRSFFGFGKSKGDDGM